MHQKPSFAHGGNPSVRSQGALNRLVWVVCAVLTVDLTTVHAKDAPEKPNHLACAVLMVGSSRALIEIATNLLDNKICALNMM
ncbi:hypothetical protein JG687_00019078 [Phytophthora cactorum]|uniref:RxLR effector protein n=2 Tax=Phytophthora TaxID=4783 RepID=A0A8J5MBW0_9STRA|nr:hypothetical protein JG687_00019078 [Phytophthora cactorum]KAG6942881.1 hypothetical protein JG688_00017874 [Phytophthora aleatoria]